MVKNNKIAGMDIDQWIDSPKISPGRGIYKKEKYEILLIAFLDVLGIKNLILYKYGKNNEYIVIDKIEKMRRIVEDVTNTMNLKYKIDYLNISDSFVFTCEPKILSELMIMLAKVQFFILLECNQLLRGAVTIGEAIMNDRGIIGPAYIRAYLIQEKYSIYPRIIIDNCVKKEILKSKVLKDSISIDTDKECYLNYIKIFMNNAQRKDSDIIEMFMSEGLFKYVKEKYDEFNTDNEEDHNIKQKYGWTIEYFKRMGVWIDDN